jgi:hypothetical protein
LALIPIFEDDLRRDVVRSATEIEVQRRIESAKSKIDQLNMQVLGDVNVLQFQITMNDVFGMEVANC